MPTDALIPLLVPDYLEFLLAPNTCLTPQHPLTPPDAPKQPLHLVGAPMPPDAP